MAVRRNLFTNIVYIIDMSSLKELHDRYPKAVFPSIWQQIALVNNNSEFFSHIEVYREIKTTIYPDDKLLKWANKNKKIFVGIDNCQNNQIPNIASRYDESYWQNEINRPAPWADPYLIAMAICESGIIITQENKTKANRIPPIAKQLNIRSLNLLEFFQELKIKL